MNAYEYAKAASIIGSDGEIAAVMRCVTAKDIAIAAVSPWLRENGLWVEGPDATSFGSLYNVYKNTTDEMVRLGLAELYASVFRGQAQTLRTTSPVIAGRVSSILSVVQSQIPGGAAMVEAFYGLAGGRPWAAITEEEITAQRLAWESEQAKASLRAIAAIRWNRVRAGIDDGSLTSEADCIAKFAEDV